MKNIITLASLTLLLTACGGGPAGETSGNTASSGDTVSTDVSSNNGTGPLGQNPDTVPLIENTADLKSSADFNFSSSRSIAIDFDVASATTSQGMMSLCTKYSKLGETYDIDYSSCTVQAPLVNGVYSGKMDITNDVNSVVGVVWFADETLAPVYKEFSLEVGAKLARRGQGPQSIVWR